MTAAQLWIRHPQTLWIRKALFQIHLWTGISLGLYVIVVSLSGSAVVFRNEFENMLIARNTVVVSGKPLTREEMKQAVQRAYPEFTVSDISRGRFPTEATEVSVVRGWTEKQRLFDPYTGRDLGPGVSRSFRWLHWAEDIHGNLLLGPTGMRVNGAAGFLVTVLCLTGLTVWWPGIATWRRGLAIRRNASWKRFTWELHSAVGFWTFSILLVWALTGAYFVYPDPFRAVINVFTTIDPPRTPQAVRTVEQGATSNTITLTIRRDRRPRTTGQKILRGFSYAHYGNFAGWPVKVLWVLLGLVPPLLFASAAIMWWSRVLSPFARRLRRDSKPEPVERTIEV